MGDSRPEINEDMYDYINLCELYGETPKTDSLGINPYSDHARELREKHTATMMGDAVTRTVTTPLVVAPDEQALSRIEDVVSGIITAAESDEEYYGYHVVGVKYDDGARIVNILLSPPPQKVKISATIPAHGAPDPEVNK